jgi:PTH1 family peptidyl-tRNA hydrolase
MKLVVGLGNPTKEYAQTWHNLGFLAIDAFAKKNAFKFNREKYQALLASGCFHREKIYLAKPLTFMNLSGDCVRALMRGLKINLSDLLVIYDDVDLELGTLRLRANGSSAGHRGIRSIIEALGSEEFSRLRIGIRQGQVRNLTKYVLKNFDAKEKKEVEKLIDYAQEAVSLWLREGTEKVMTKVNRKWIIKEEN